MKKKEKNILMRIIISGMLCIIAFLIPAPGLIKSVLFLTAYIVIGYDILRKAFLGIINGQVFDENFLMSIATLGAVLLGDYAESCAVMLFFQVGELFESRALDKSRKSIAALMDIAPETANIETGEGKLEEVDPEDVEVGSIIVVRPGERIPVDGIIESGNSVINTSALTGESLPVEAGQGDEVISGCINMTGLLRIRTTKLYEDSTVAKILELVESAADRKSGSEQFISRFAKYYTPAVCIGAALLAVIPPLFRIIVLSDVPLWAEWITRGLTFLVISCPCALVISIPLSFFGGIGAASSAGILIKGSNYLEGLSKASGIVFDKTGTLTKGEFEILEIHPQGISKDGLLELAVYAEVNSNHPISRCIRKAWGKEIEKELISDVKEIAGKGTEVKVGERIIAAGNSKLMEICGIDISGTDKTKISGTVVHVSENGIYRGCIVLGDTVKDDAKDTVYELSALGIKKITVFTGDSKEAALPVGKRLGIEDVRYGLLPQNKVEMMESMMKSKPDDEKLIFVGDGINDAPVLMRSDIGIAMGALGSDAAIEAADIVLMDDSLKKIPLAMKISTGTMKIVYENIIFALAVKGLCLLLGAVGLVGMWAAIFADVGVMIIAVLNAMRCLKVPGDKK